MGDGVNAGKLPPVVIRRCFAGFLAIATPVNPNPRAECGPENSLTRWEDQGPAEILAEAFRERVLRTDDAKEGPRAFMEKRDPRWTSS